jgi:hypothetical protein
MADQTKVQQEKFRVSVEDGKYTYVFYKDGGSEMLRNGQPWISTTGDKAMYAFAARVFDLEQAVSNLNLPKALEMALCVEINLNNLIEQAPWLKNSPLFRVVTMQLKETIIHLGGESV